MFKPLELFVGLRYTRAKRRNHFISFITLISMLGIAVGITALITVISVMNGFEKELRERILGMTAHATIQGYGTTLSDWHELAAQAERHPRVIGVAPYIQAEAMLISGRLVSGAMVRGILPSEESKVSQVEEKMVAGNLNALQEGHFGIVLGRELALSLGVSVGNKVTVIAPEVTVTPAGLLPRLKRFTVVGLFEVGMYEYDRGLALMHMDDAVKLLRLENGVTSVRLKLDDLFVAPRVVRELSAQMRGTFAVSDWTRQHENFFRAVRTEKTVMFVILFLIVAVAAFNIVSTLVMVVTDKESDIAILRTLGATPASVMAIFIVQGSLIGLVGTLLGIAGGVSLALNVEAVVLVIERLFGVQFLAPDVYYISALPSDMHWSDVFRIAILAFLLAILATLYPAWRAARTRPAEALRYE
jgi:lipoprotein releasing system, transmembrane protein, LolC/E family